VYHWRLDEVQHFSFCHSKPIGITGVLTNVKSVSNSDFFMLLSALSFKLKSDRKRGQNCEKEVSEQTSSINQQIKYLLWLHSLISQMSFEVTSYPYSTHACRIIVSAYDYATGCLYKVYNTSDPGHIFCSVCESLKQTAKK